MAALLARHLGRFPTSAADDEAALAAGGGAGAPGWREQLALRFAHFEKRLLEDGLAAVRHAAALRDGVAGAGGDGVLNHIVARASAGAHMEKSYFVA